MTWYTERRLAAWPTRIDRRTGAQGVLVADSGPVPSTGQPGGARPRSSVRFLLRSRPHHRTDTDALAAIYRVKDSLRIHEQLHDVAERVAFRSARTASGEWLQHIEFSGASDPAGWPVLCLVLCRIVERHPGWVLSWEE
jgi:hypothetical protein